MFKVMNGLVVASMALLLVASCSTDNHRGGFQRFLTDPDDLNDFPVDDRRRLRQEYDRLPQSMMVRVPTDENGRRVPENAEARYFDQRVDFDNESVPMHHRWSQGRDSDRLAIAHHMSHMVDHREFRKKHRKFHKKHHRHGWQYNSYTPYYRSAYNSNYWWNSYTFYRSYPYGQYEYCVYYPRYRYSYYPTSYFNYSYY